MNDPHTYLWPMFMRICLLCLATLLFWQCQEEQEKTPAASEQKVVSPPEWEGTYTGVVPCADCEGISTTLTLNRDMTYALQTRYLGKGFQTYDRRSTFRWDNTGKVAILNEITD